MNYYLCIAAVAVVTGLQSCASHKEQEPVAYLREMAKSPDSKIGSEQFQFALPEGWRRVDTLLEGNKVTFIMKEGDALRPMINVTNESMGSGAHLAYVMNAKRYLINNTSEVRITDEGSFDISGKSCVWYAYNRIQNGITREMVFYSIAHNGISTNITAGINPGGRVRYKAVFDKIVRSFRVER